MSLIFNKLAPFLPGLLNLRAGNCTGGSNPLPSVFPQISPNSTKKQIRENANRRNYVEKCRTFVGLSSFVGPSVGPNVGLQQKLKGFKNENKNESGIHLLCNGYINDNYGNYSKHKRRYLSFNDFIRNRYIVNEKINTIRFLIINGSRRNARAFFYFALPLPRSTTGGIRHSRAPWPHAGGAVGGGLFLATSVTFLPLTRYITTNISGTLRIVVRN